MGRFMDTSLGCQSVSLNALQNSTGVHFSVNQVDIYGNSFRRKYVFSLGRTSVIFQPTADRERGCNISNCYIVKEVEQRFSTAARSILQASQNCKIVFSQCNQTELQFQPRSTKMLQSNTETGQREVYNPMLICDTFEFDIHNSVLVSSRPPVMSVMDASASARLLAEMYSI